MKNFKRLTRTLLIMGLLLGCLWTALPPAGEAEAPTPTSDENDKITWELTPEAIARTDAGECDPSAASGLDVCREECEMGWPTGKFACFPD